MAWEPSEYKKDVTGEMPSAYDPKSVEGCWGEFWEKEGLMGADAEVREQGRDRLVVLRLQLAPELPLFQRPATDGGLLLLPMGPSHSNLTLYGRV